MVAGYYSFAAIRGRWGNNDYYVAQCPVQVASKILSFDDSDIPDGIRKLVHYDETEIKTIIRRIVSSGQDYVLNALVVAIGSEVSFDPIRHDFTEIGILKIPFEATMLICGGQNQYAALRKLLDEQMFPKDNMLPIIFVSDEGLRRAASIYINLNEKVNNRSQQVLVKGNDLSLLTINLADNLPIFRNRIEKTKTTISNRSTALFTLSALYQATQALLDVKETEELTDYQSRVARDFWFELGNVLIEWQKLSRGETTPSHLRSNFVHVHTVSLIAFGKAGNALIAQHPQDWRTYLQKLINVDWSRRNTEIWEGRSMVRGRMSKAQDSIILTTNLFKQVLGLPLSTSEQELEKWTHS